MSPIQYPSPRQPRAIKLANRCGRVLQAFGILVPRLDPERLMAEARRNTGFNDFGDDSFIAGLETLIEAVEREAQLSQVGRAGTCAAVVAELETRLKITAYRQERPEVAQQNIKRPLFIVGLPRTGSTILYEMLAQDPTHRSPVSWEVARPVPPAKEETYNRDPRIAELEKQLDMAAKLAPEFNSIHALGAQLPQECVAIFASHFSSDAWRLQFHVPTYQRWYLAQDMTTAYQWHYQFLQHMQIDYFKPRWLLKTPSHIANLDALVAQYPDAAIVQTHRDPLKVIASTASMACSLNSAFSDHIDPFKVARGEVENYATMIERGMAQRDAMPDADSRFFDAQFDALLADPLAVIEQIYAHFDFELTEQARGAMLAYLDNRPRNKHGEHRYSLDMFGLDAQQDGLLFKAYRQRYCQPSHQ